MKEYVPLWAALILCFFCLAGLIRLAYFNVTEEERQKSTDEKRHYYMGLPITASSLILPMLYLLTLITPKGDAAIMLGGLAITGILYISPVKIKKPNLFSVILFSVIGVIEGIIVILKVNGII